MKMRIEKKQVWTVSYSANNFSNSFGVPFQEPNRYNVIGKFDNVNAANAAVKATRTGNKFPITNSTNVDVLIIETPNGEVQYELGAEVKKAYVSKETLESLRYSAWHALSEEQRMAIQGNFGEGFNYAPKPVAVESKKDEFFEASRGFLTEGI